MSVVTVGMLIAALPANPAHAEAAGAPDSRQPIIVTGTRINVPQTEDVEPIVTLDASYVRERNLSQVADALNEIPGIRSSFTPNGIQAAFGQGVNFLNIYALGAQRTLTLVNGKRMVSSNGPTLFSQAAPGTQVDVNAIPTILVERVDRLAIGGAPVYGSDAIAGTVNIILKRRLNGLETRALSGVSDRGDNFRWKLAAAGGGDFAGGRGNITAALSYDHSEGVASRQRSFFRDNLGSAPNPCTAFQPGLCTPFGTVAMLGPPGRTPASDGRVNAGIGFNDSASDGNPGSILVRQFSLAAVAPGGVVSSGPGAFTLRFAPDGSLVGYDRGTLYGAPLAGPLAAAAMASGGDGFKLFDHIGVTSQLKRLNAALSLTYDISDRLSFTTDALYYHGEASEVVDLPTFNAILFQGQSGALTFRTDNPFLTAQARERLAALGYGETFQLSRANTDLADRSGSSESDLYRVVAGLEGSFGLGGRDYSFELSAVYGRNDFTDYGQAIDQQRFVNAVNVVATPGGIACSVTPTVTGLGASPVADPACVPLNLFGTGAPSAEALDYVLRDTVARSRLEQRVVNANLGGAPFDLFGNPVAFNIGYEHREEKARFSPDSFLQAGLGRSVPIAPVSGGYNLDELFGEVIVPLITPDNDAPIDRLVAFARGRRVMSSVTGDFTAWSAGGTFAPVSDIALRGNYTRSFRSPAILELFSPRAGVAVAVPDLCSPAQIDAGPVPDIRRANCTAFLDRYPNATPLIAATATVPGIAGGNPDLRNERAESYTFGAVLTPRFVPGLAVSADYLAIDIADPIAYLTVSEIAQGCFDNPQFDAADPANGNPFCSLIGRDADGQVLSDSQQPAVTTGFVNGKRIRFRGVQAALDYHSGLDRIGLPGTLGIGADLFNVRRRIKDITGVAPARSDGTVADPAWQGQLRLRYTDNTWGIRTHVNYTGRQAIARDNRGPAPNDLREFDHFGAFTTVDASLFVKTDDGVTVTLSVTNLFDRVGQHYFGYIIPLSVNDALGRRFAISVGKSW